MLLYVVGPMLLYGLYWCIAYVVVCCRAYAVVWPILVYSLCCCMPTYAVVWYGLCCHCGMASACGWHICWWMAYAAVWPMLAPTFLTHTCCIFHVLPLYPSVTIRLDGWPIIPFIALQIPILPAAISSINKDQHMRN